MRNAGIWIITLMIVVLFILGMSYYRITDSVVNSASFAISLTIIFIVLIVIIASTLKKDEVKSPKVTEVK